MFADLIEGNWMQVKGQIKETWGELINDDLLMAQGKLDKLTGLLQERYGMTKDESLKDIKEFFKNITLDKK